MRVAFFGSDKFSLTSLKAVHKFTSDLVVITRRLKPQGRGQRTILVPPIVEYARSHNLAWNEVEGLNDFENIDADLAIAVSYGHLLPASFLQRVQAGLNVHPSLLPALRGAAPLQRAIMRQLPYTGVSVQALHPTRFDHGDIFWHSARQYLEPRETTATLSSRLATVGAEGLLQVIRNINNIEPLPHLEKASRAPIIDRSEFQLISKNSAYVEDARGRALGKLWFEREMLDGKKVRTNLSDFVPVTNISSQDQLVSLPGDVLGVRCGDGRYLGARGITLAGSIREGASGYLRRSRQLGPICT